MMMMNDDDEGWKTGSLHIEMGKEEAATKRMACPDRRVRLNSLP